MQKSIIFYLNYKMKKRAFCGHFLKPDTESDATSYGQYIPESEWNSSCFQAWSKLNCLTYRDVLPYTHGTANPYAHWNDFEQKIRVAVRVVKRKRVGGGIAAYLNIIGTIDRARNAQTISQTHNMAVGLQVVPYLHDNPNAHVAAQCLLEVVLREEAQRGNAVDTLSEELRGDVPADGDGVA